MTIQPGKRPFDNPTFGQDLKADLVGRAFHNVKRPPKMLFRPSPQLAAITAIRPNAFQTAVLAGILIQTEL